MTIFVTAANRPPDYPAQRSVPTSKSRVAAVDHKTVGSVIGRCLAHEIDGNAAEIAGLAETAHWNARHHGADKFVVSHDLRGHVASDPARQDGIGRDAVTG